MAGWGALSGLGAALQDVGGTLTRDVLARRMETQREARADAREEAKRARRPDPSQTTFLERDGVLYKQTKNADGKVLDEALASADEIENRNFDRQKRDITLRGLEAKLQDATQDAALGALKLEDYDEDRQYERDKDARAEARANRGLDIQERGIAARLEAATSKKADDDEELSVYDYVDELKKVDADLLDEYDDLFADEAAKDKYLTRVVENAERTGTNKRTALRQALQHSKKSLKAPIHL